jgi:hypothetical protein
MWLGQVGRGRGLVLACIDDLQWADGPSARALLFAVRRLQADQVLVVLSARAGELPGLGEGWPRFVAGDHRAGRVLLGGLGPGDVVALGRAPGAGELPRRAPVTWRHGTKAAKGNPGAAMTSHFLAIRVRPANRDIPRAAAVHGR